MKQVERSEMTVDLAKFRLCVRFLLARKCMAPTCICSVVQ
jgi:hypothetical protein